MKKTMITAIALMGLFTLSAQATELTFSQQLEAQKQQLRPQAFNFFSDRYLQVSSHSVVSAMTFKQQLDSQKSALRPHKFNPISDAYYQTHI